MSQPLVKGSEFFVPFRVIHSNRRRCSPVCAISKAVRTSCATDAAVSTLEHYYGLNHLHDVSSSTYIDGPLERLTHVPAKHRCD